jgi:hypothetical protein
MSTNSAAEHQASSVFDGLPELLRDLKQDLLPRVPWRAAAVWGVALGATFVIRSVYDIFNPTTDWALRSQLSTLAGVTICFCAGFHGAWRRKDFGHGGAVTMLAILIGFFVAIFGSVAAVYVISTFHTLNLARELYGALDVPLQAMVLLGGSVGALGAAIAVGTTRLRARTVLQS